MCEPISATTLATASLVATAAGTAATMYGQHQAGKAASGQAKYQAQVARNNQIIAERQAEDALKRGENAELQHRKQVSQLKGRQRAVLAGNGVVVDQDSALDILGDTAAQGELDALTIRSNAEREAYGYRVQGSNFAADAGLLDARARNAGNTGLAMGTTLLSGVGSVSDRWFTYSRAKNGSG